MGDAKLFAGRCLCGEVRYELIGEPDWVTICHCRFCQRATGTDYMVEPVFDLDCFRLTHGTPKIYRQTSVGSGKAVNVEFCSTCGTKLRLTFERFPDVCGVYAGTMDDPNSFAISPTKSWHIFTAMSRDGVILPPGVECHAQHGLDSEGNSRAGTIHDRPYTTGS